MKKDLLETILGTKKNTTRNSMGCSESWYNFYFAMKQTFTKEEMEKMIDHEVALLERLHENTSDGLY